MQSSTISSDLYIPDGANLAPIKPLRDLKDKKSDKDVQDHPLVQQIKEKYDDLISREKTAWKEMVSVGQTVALFIQGHQALEINEFNGLPRIVKPRSNDLNKIKAVNLMRYYSTNWQSKWGSSNPDVILTPYSNKDEALTQARKANAVVDYLEDKFYNPYFHLHEGLMAQVWGWYGRRVRPDFTAKAFSAFKEIVEEKETPIGQGYGKCLDCGKESTKAKPVQLNPNAPPMMSCPECDSTAYDYTPPITINLKYVARKERIFLPEIICEQVYFPATRWEMSKRYEDSPWAITEKYISQNALRSMFSGIRFPAGESGNGFGLDAMTELAKTGAAVNGTSYAGTRQNGEDAVLSIMSLSAEEAWEIQIGKDEKTVEGQTLPKGKRLGELYGACTITGINGMALIIGIHKGHHSETDTSGVYHMKPMSGTGHGVIDVLESQKQLNRRTYQLDRQIAARATPGTLFVENAIAPQYRKLLSRPDADIPVKISNFPEFRDLSQLVRPMQGENAPATLVNSLQHIQSMMELQYHITDFTGGLGSRVQNDTATGAEILESNAESLFSPALTIKADVTVETARKGFELWCKHTPVGRFLPFKKARGNSVGIEISGKDVQGEYKWSYTEGSEIPKTRFTEQKKKDQFFMRFGNAANYLTLKQQMPTEVAAIERAFDVSFGDDGYDTTAELCRKRWEMALQLLKMQGVQGQIETLLMGQASPTDFDGILAAIEPSMLVTEGGHPDKIKWFVDLLNSEEGQSASSEERDLMSAFILGHQKLQAGQAIGEGQLAMAVQTEIEAPMREQAMAEQNALREEETAKEVIGGVATLSEAEAARAHELKLKGADVAQGLLTAAVETEGARE